jgi:deazaflavin-dependent oxidoreductase (nitroreductase family)
MASNAIDYKKPSGVERVFGRVLVALLRVGLVRGHFYVLEVRGRSSGKTISLPVDPIDMDGKRYLVSARGNTNWVRNARAAGEVVLTRAMRRKRYAARELPAEERSPILQAYLDQFATEVQRFFPVPKGSPARAFEELASRYPVFELRE